MTKRQIAKYGMFHIILHFFFRHLDIVKKVPALYKAVNSFQGYLTTIDTIAPVAVKKTTGATAAKKQLRVSLTAQALFIVSLLLAFAAAKKDEELKKKIRYTKGELDKLANEELPPVCKLILAAAGQNADQMADYLLTQDVVKGFETSITNFEDVMTKPQLEEREKGVAADQVVIYFNHCDNILENHTDPLMTNFKQSDPEFYNGYKKNRRINDPVTRHTRLAGKVTDPSTGKGVAGVEVLHQATGLKTTTDENGEFVLQIPLTGKHPVVFIKDGYETVNTAAELTLGQTTTVTISLEKVK